MRRNSRNRNRKNKKKNDINHVKVSKTLIIIISILLLILICFSCFFYYKNKLDYKNLVETSKKEIEDIIDNESNKTTEEKEEKTDTTFTLTAVGDVLCHNTQYLDAYVKDSDSYDFSYVFDDIKQYTKLGDISVASLETSFAGKERGYSNYPKFNSPDELAFALKDIGIDVISTAGNHALDMGYSGLSRTIDILDKADISHLGTYKTKEEQEKILIKYVKGLKLGFINYTYGTNGIPVPSDKPFCVNLIDKDLIKKQIDAAKEQNVDILIACMHWGTEYKTSANDNQKELADFLFKNGVDIIIGNHPHVLEPMEKITVTLDDGSTKDGFVIYALGNFISDQNAKNTRNSIILNLTITKHVDGKTTIDKAKYIPIYMYKNPKAKLHKMKLLDIKKTIYNYENYIDTSIDKNLYNLLKNELNTITSIVGPEIN